MSIKITPKMFATLDSNVQAAISSLVEVKPKRVLSPEHLAKLKAGRETKQALKRLAKLAAAEDETLPESIPVIESVAVTVPEPVAPVEQKKRGPKPLASKTPEELATHKTRVAERKAGREAAKAKKLAAAPEPLPVAEPKPKRTLSPEHLAKLKAGREAAKAKKPVSPEAPRPTIDIPLDSLVPDEPVVVEPVVSIIPEELAADKAPKVTFKEPVTEVQPTEVQPTELQPTEVQPTEVQPTVAGPKKRGPKPLASKTPEELLAHKLKLEERRAIRKNATELLPLPLFKLKSA